MTALNLLCLLLVVPAASVLPNETSTVTWLGFEPKDLMTWIVSLASVGIAAGGLLWTSRSIRAESNAKQAANLVSVENELHKIENESGRYAPMGSKRRISWEIRFLNIVGRHAWLIKKGIYPFAFEKYLSIYFQWGRDIIENSIFAEVWKNNYKEIIDICRDNFWPAYDPDKNKITDPRLKSFLEGDTDRIETTIPSLAIVKRLSGQRHLLAIEISIMHNRNGALINEDKLVMVNEDELRQLKLIVEDKDVSVLLDTLCKINDSNSSRVVTM